MNALVLQLNHITYAECAGKLFDLPCKAGEVEILGDYYGVPQKESGIFRGYNIVKANAAPTPDSIPLVRIHVVNTGDTYHVLGTAAEWRTACDGGAALPGAATIPIVVPEINLCKPLTVGGTDYTVHFTPPAKTGGQTYTVAAMYNNTQAAAPGTGLADLAAVVTYLNTNFATAGTWSADSGRLKLVRATAAKVGVTFKVVG